MKRILLALLTLLCLGQAQAQQSLGLTGSNYSGTHGIFLNPASIADSRLGFYLDLVSVQAGATNNYSRLPLGVSKFNDLDNDSFMKRSNGQSKFANILAQAQVLSFMVKMSPVHSFAFTNRVRFGISGNGVSEQLANVIFDGADEKDLIGQSYSGVRFNMNVNAYKETGLTYARVIKVTPDYTLKGGITINRLHGITSAYIVSKDLDFSVSEIPDNQEDPTILNIQRINMQYAYVPSDVYDNALENTSIGTFFGKGLPGRGWGVNLGVTFEKPEIRSNVKEGKQLIDSLKAVHKGGAKPKLSKMTNNYRYRVGVSLMDIGSIRYKGNSIRSYDISRTNKEIALNDLSGSLDDITGTINRALNVNETEVKNSFTTGLPTALQVNFDYHLTGKLYVNTVWVQNLRGKYATGMRQTSMLAVTPRLEMRWFEIALPVALAGNYRNLTLGTYIKAGILHVGSDNIAGILGMGKTYGLDIYTGLHIPVFAKNKQAK